MPCGGNDVIWESGPWKRYLARCADALRRRKEQRRWLQASYAAAERDIFLSAYAVRKLLDAGDISDEVESQSLRAAAYPPRGRTVDVMNSYRIQELYDLSAQSEVALTLRDFCNQVVHSFVFSLGITPSGGLEGFFLASDREKERRLLYFHIDNVLDALLRVADDDIVTMEISRDGVGMPAKITKKSNRLGPGARPLR
jgi:hypothetical protein